MRFDFRLVVVSRGGGGCLPIRAFGLQQWAEALHGGAHAYPARPRLRFSRFFAQIVGMLAYARFGTGSIFIEQSKHPMNLYSVITPSGFDILLRKNHTWIFLDYSLAKKDVDLPLTYKISRWLELEGWWDVFRSGYVRLELDV